MNIESNRLNNLKVFKTAREGIIYRLNNDVLYKRLKNPNEYDYNTLYKLMNIPKRHNININKPIDIVYEKGKFKGYTFKEVKGIRFDYYLKSDIELKFKLQVFKEIGNIIKYMDSHLYFNHIYIGDLKEDNIIVDKDNKPVIIDANGFKTSIFYDPLVYYIDHNPNLRHLSKYNYGKGTINRKTDIYCLNAMIFNYISNSSLDTLDIYYYISYLKYLKRKGASINLVRALISTYDGSDIKLASDYLDGLPKNIDKYTMDRFDKRLTKRLFR